uniref:RNase H type-1 domain-containing protein n=1 Tax=Hordeum vulgare subsp. vulgare TaxID=112509 RepID=A0A8I6XXT3_HORVV
MVRWEAPLAGWLKLNFDGSVYNDGSGRASIGGAIRDCTGRVLVAFAEPTEHSTVGIVEARALIRGLRLALTRFRGGLVAEGDDLMLVQLLTGEETQTRIPLAMQKEILMLLGCFATYKVQHIFREGNQVAHVLCNEAYERPGVWAGGIVPRTVWEKAQDDVHGVAHERLCKKKKL